MNDLSEILSKVTWALKEEDADAAIDAGHLIADFVERNVIPKLPRNESKLLICSVCPNLRSTWAGKICVRTGRKAHKWPLACPRRKNQEAKRP